MQKKLIILDRDGVINKDSDNYIKSPQEWIPIEGSLEAIAKLKQAGLPIAVATNQSGVGRGYYSLNTLSDMHSKMQNLLKPLGAKIDLIQFCPHLPDDGCECRKPKPGMLLSILENFAMKPEDAIMVGDTMGDYYASNHAGIAFALVKTGKGKRTLANNTLPSQVAVYDNLASFVDDILEGFNS